MLERLRQKFREHAAARGRDMDRPRGDRPVAKRRGPRERGDRPSPEAARRGPPKRGDRPAPKARRDRPSPEAARRDRPEAARRGRPERAERRGDDMAEMAKAIGRLEQQMRRLAERLEAIQREVKGSKERPRREGDRPR